LRALRLNHWIPCSAIALATLCAASLPAEACTLWGAAGSASSDGTLLVKNRDWKPDHVQSLRLVHSKHGLSFVGLYADNGRSPGIKAGVNQAGLSVVSASASSLPRAVREEDRERHGIITDILRQYHTLDDVASHASQIFPHARPIFLLLADASGLMQVEIGQDGKFDISRSQSGTLAHTNHYFAPALLNQEQTIGSSSATRLSRIQTLLQQQAAPHSLNEFSQLSNDRHDGPDNSLWRSGKEYTLASWQIALSKSGSPKLHLVMANPGTQQRSSDWQLDAAFWQRPAQVLSAATE
jgi:hypothetical protein